MIWDPKKNFSDRNDLFPIITPAYPQQNSTYNITHSSRQVICKEIKRAYEITKEIYETMGTKSDWGKLFEKIDFFNEYRHFIVIIISANNEENFEFWTGHVESKVRKMIKFLDQNDFVEEAHVNLHNNPTCTTHSEETGKEWHVKKWIIGMKFRKQEGVRRKVCLTPDIRLFKDHVMDPTNCPQYDIQNPELYQLACKYCRHTGIAEHLSEEDAKNIKVSNKKISLDVVNKIDTTPQKPVVKQESPQTQEKAPETKQETPVKEEPKKPENNRSHPYKNNSIVSPSTPPSSQSKSSELIGGEKPQLKISPIKPPQQQKPKEVSMIPTVVSSNYNSQGSAFKSAPLIKPPHHPQQQWVLPTDGIQQPGPEFPEVPAPPGPTPGEPVQFVQPLQLHQPHQ